MTDAAAWLKSTIDVECSEFGATVAALLDGLYYGIYHVDLDRLRRADWTDVRYIRVIVDDGLATYDADTLTRLVLLCHEMCVRVEINQGGPRRLALCFTKRESREGRMFARHPTIETAIATIRGES